MRTTRTRLRHVDQLVQVRDLTTGAVRWLADDRAARVPAPRPPRWAKLLVAAAVSSAVLAGGWLTADVLAGISTPQATAAGPDPRPHNTYDRQGAAVRTYTPDARPAGAIQTRGRTLAIMSRAPHLMASSRPAGDGGPAITRQAPVPAGVLGPVVEQVEDTRLSVGQTLDGAPQMRPRLPATALRAVGGHNPPEHAETPSVNRR